VTAAGQPADAITEDRLLGGYDPNAGRSAHAAARPQLIPVPSLLRALLSEHLDPGYAAVAARRGSSGSATPGRERAFGWLWQALAALLIATVFAAAVAQARSVAPGVRTAQQLLLQSVRSSEVAAATLGQERGALSTRVDDVQRHALAENAQGQRLLASLDALGLANEQGPWLGRPLPERMAYALTKQGRVRSEEISRAGTRYAGPAPVSLHEYRLVLAEAAKPGTLDLTKVSAALSGIELAPGVTEAVRAAVNSRSSIFIYGAPGNGKTSLARRIPRLLGGPIVVPIALDIGGGEVMTVFDPALHKLEANQPADRRWRRIGRPLVQVGGEFQIEMFDPTWEDGSRTYAAPLQVKANGGVLLIDDLGRQRVPPKQILDRLLVPLEQEIDYMNLSASGRKVEVPFWAQLALSTNLKPAELLDEAYLRRLAYKVLMPDPTWEMWTRIFERERERLTIPPDSKALEMIRSLYGGRPLRGNHPRDLLERLVDVSSARGSQPQLTPELLEAAWHTLFITS